ncbi:MAG TPA: oligosaccharide flippase family protein, partial [Chitinophagaceae bacterium]|nr:oligosaccharide flippase family protein [Chitinophagaceae bacterium]
MPGKLLRDLSASTLQVITNQALGVIVFLITSLYLSKHYFGELNWSVAIFTFAYTLLSLRLEQIVVRKSAIEPDSSKIMTLYLVHVLICGIGFYLLVLLLKLIFPSFFTTHSLLWVIGISQLLSFISSPFKQVANGKERFDYLAIMSSISNLVRVVLLTIGIALFSIDMQWVLIIFIISSFIELSVCFFLVRFRMNIALSRTISLHDYITLLKNSLPQIGSALLMAGITRMDWILLGVFSTSAITAEYSFAYRVFELSPFPLLIIAPLLLSRFSKYFAHNKEQLFLTRKKELGILVRAEMIAATLIPLVLNIIWTPLIDSLTGNKYGLVNQYTFLILSFCIPFQYISNIIWSAHFAMDRLKLILKITITTFCIILVGDLLFIPLYGSKGAALVFLLAMITEYVNYMRSSELAKIKETWQSLLICLLAAAGSGFAAIYFLDTTLWRLISALLSFFFLLLA